MSSPNLNDDERLQSGSTKTRKYLEKRLAALREKNDDLMPNDDRMALIGEIKAVKGLLLFMRTKPVTTHDESSD